MSDSSRALGFIELPKLESNKCVNLHQSRVLEGGSPAGKNGVWNVSFPACALRPRGTYTAASQEVFK